MGMTKAICHATTPEIGILGPEQIAARRARMRGYRWEVIVQAAIGFFCCPCCAADGAQSVCRAAKEWYRLAGSLSSGARTLADCCRPSKSHGRRRTGQQEHKEPMAA